MMQRSLLALAILTAGTASATPFTGNDTRSNAMGNTGVASAESFAASQFNPALLSAYDDSVDFGLQLPSIRFAIDDGYGFIKAANVTEDFENTDTNEIVLQVNGGGSVISLSQALTNVTDASAGLNDGDGVTEAELEEFEDANTVLSNKIDTIQTEMNNLDNAITNANDSISTLSDKPLSILGSIGTAIAIPRSGLGLALHLNTSANLGMRADIGQNDLDKISGVVSATSGYTAEAQDLSNLSSALSTAANGLSQYTGDPCSTGDNGDDFDAFLIAQANLQAENDGADVTVLAADFCNRGTNYDAEYDGDNVETYDSGDGIYINGELQASATEGLGDDSSITILGANIVELGVSAAREVTYLGQTFSVGVTPKIQSLQIFEDTVAFDEAGSVDSSTLSQNTTTAFTGNLDIGIAKNWYNVAKGQVRAGLVVKDLIPQTFESASGRELEMGPKARIGVAHETRFSTVALDLDLTENEPLGYGVTTRYIGLGGEFDAFNWMKIRAGYRNNLSVDDSHVVTTGLGFTPFGVGLDLTGWFSPSSEWEEIVQDAGFATQFSMNW